MTNIRDILAYNLVRHRKIRGFSQGELAHQAKVNRTYISAIERKKFSATVDIVSRLAQVLGISTHDLLLDKEIYKKPEDFGRSWPNYTSKQIPSIVDVNLSTLPIFECAALVISYLSYPELDNIAYWNRVNLERAICNNFLRMMVESYPDWGLCNQLLRPAYLLISKSDVDKALSGLYRQAKKRFAVAEAMGNLIGFDSDLPLNNVEPFKERALHLGKMAEEISPNVTENDTKNILSRIVSPGLSVVHVALALNCLESNGYTSSDNLEEKIQVLCSNRDALHFLLETAEGIRSIILSSVRTSQDLRVLIQFTET